MRERRSARVGTVSGLALLTGGTAVAAVAHGESSIFASLMLGLLAAGLGHALATEIQRQARRGTPTWAAQDTINTILLAAWTAGALTTALLPITPGQVRAVGLLLTFAYALSTAHFVLERRRTLTAHQVPAAEPGQAHRPRSTGPTPEHTHRPRSTEPTPEHTHRPRSTEPIPEHTHGPRSAEPLPEHTHSRDTEQAHRP